MRISISNIAWEPEHDEDVARLLSTYGIDAIDVAPGKYFSRPAETSDSDIAKVKDAWARRGIAITGMQALLFGTTGLNLFGPSEVQDAMLNHLSAMCRIGAGLGATRLVFGSPKNRDRSNLSDSETLGAAVPFFKRLGDVAASHGVTVCLEANPVSYGANFMTTSDETAHVVQEVGHPAIKMQFDTGAVALNGENVFFLLEQYADLVGHVHISEPKLVPIGDSATNHAEIASAFRIHVPQHVLAIEMLSPKSEPPLMAIERAVKTVVTTYRASV
jgi:sugar phosphate isomerase/epimerase